MPNLDRWADIKAFVAPWADPIAPGDGYPPELKELEIENGYLVFWSENQYVCHWAVAESDLALENPPVFLLSDFTGGIWKPEAARNHWARSPRHCSC